MINSATELLLLQHASSSLPEVNYTPTKVSTDKRRPASEKTTLGYYQIGVSEHYGFAYGPIFKVEFVDLASITATHIKIWGIDNENDDAPEYPISYLTANPIVEVYLRKFEFTDGAGNVVAPGGTYTIVGYKKKALPYSW